MFRRSCQLSILIDSLKNLTGLAHDLSADKKTRQRAMDGHAVSLSRFGLKKSRLSQAVRLLGLFGFWHLVVCLLLVSEQGVDLFLDGDLQLGQFWL